MKIITFDQPHRQKHFDFFNQMDQPHFGLSANVDITDLLRDIQQQQLPFTVVMVYLLSRAANQVPTFRWRIRGTQVVEHEWVHPSFTVKTAVSDVFSFCMVPFNENFDPFLAAAQTAMDKMYHAPSFEDEPGRDDFLYLSAMPWVSFTSVMHPMHYHPVDSVPRLVWGKYFEEGGRIKMPLAVQAHHAVVDGVHLGHFFQKVEALLEPEAWRRRLA